MAPGEGARRVHFAVQQQGAYAYAIQLRLTPALLEALLAAQDAGRAASICFGEVPQSNAITVGDAAFRFNALAEESCDLLRLAPSTGGSPAIVGAVRQKLMVQRNIEDERVRVRARAEEAERRGQERKAQLLGKPAASQAMPRTKVQRLTPPPSGQPQQRGPTPPPARQQQVTASMLSAPAGKPPTHPAGRGLTPPPPAAAAAAPAPKAVHKSASAGKLGGGKHSSAGSMGSLQLAASPLVLRAARSGASLRLCLIAILAERPMSMNAIKAVLSDAASRVKSFKVPGKEQVERALKAVAEFKAPGLYVLYPVLLKELEEGLPGGGGGDLLAPAEQQASPPVPSVDGAPATKKRRAASAAPAGAAPATAGDRGGVQRRPPAAGKRARLDWTDDDSSDAEQQPAAQRTRQQPAAVHTASAPAAVAAAASPPSVGGGPAGASSGSGGAVAGGAGVPLRRTSSSRGSDQADESWIEEHADRQPQPAAPIHSKEEYHERAAAFNSKYEVYFALHQLIEAHKRDFEGLDAAIRCAASEAERDRHRTELERLHRRRGERAKRWDAAYKVLHQELAAAKARMAEFVRQLQCQQQQEGGGPGSAAPVVRVK